MSQKIEKLVRDKIPEIIKKKGIEPNIHIADIIEYRKSLKEKLLEESLEVKNALNKEEIIEEIADVYEVIDALMEEYSLSETEIMKVKEKKKTEKGGFKKRIISRF